MMTSAAKIELLRKLPKIELHIHLEGSIQPTTALELARKNDVDLPPCNSPEELYSYTDLNAFLGVYTAISQSVVKIDDFRRITYEMLENAAQSGARYVEFFISPHAHKDVPFADQFEGIRAGMRDALADYRIRSAIISGMNRQLGADAGEEYLDEILANRADDLIGLGLDYYEAPFPPELYGDVFARARKAGLRLSAHAGEAGPAAFVAGSIDALHVDRIDHGYNIVDNPDLVARCRDMGIMFTCCPSTTKYTTEHRDLKSPDHPIRVMKESGLAVSINSDDPPMFRTDLNTEFVVAMDDLGFSAHDIGTSIQATIDHSWADDADKRQWRAEWTPEIDLIVAQLQRQ